MYMQDYIIDIDTGIYRITPDGKVYSQPKRKIPLVGKGMEFTGEFKHILGKEREMSVRVNNRGYKTVSFNRTTHMVHKLVARGFIANPEGKLYVNHMDGNKLNNHYSNLEWCTIAENNKHARETGLHVQAKGHKIKYKSDKTKTKSLANLKDKTILTDEQVRYVREVYIPRHVEFGASALARRFGVSNVAMSNAINGKTFTNIK